MKRKVGCLLYALVGLVFVYAGILKLLDPQAFQAAILTYRLFDYQQAASLALFAPSLEVLAGLLLATGLWRGGARLLIWALLLAFLILISQAWARGLSIDCGCFGTSEANDALSYAKALGKDLALGLMLYLASLWAPVETKRR